MAADRARADEEDLKVSPFQKGEWEQTRPTELDVDYALLAEALGPAGAPVAELHDATVAALDWTRAEFGAYDVVLAADCVYDEALATPLVRAMSYAMRDGAVALVTVDEANRRPAALRAFLRVAERAFSYFREEPMAARSKWSRGDDRESIRLFVLRGPRLFNHQKPLRVVVAGPCGCGKTTICDALVERFAADGKQCAALSYDDFYLTHAEQNDVAKAHENNRLLELRGNGGTHDLQLFDDVLTCVEIKISRCTRRTG